MSWAKEINERDVMCPLKLEVFKDPVKMNCCQQIVEESFIKDHVSWKGKCPFKGCE